MTPEVGSVPSIFSLGRLIDYGAKIVWDKNGVLLTLPGKNTVKLPMIDHCPYAGPEVVKDIEALKRQRYRQRFREEIRCFREVLEKQQARRRYRDDLKRLREESMKPRLALDSLESIDSIWLKAFEEEWQALIDTGAIWMGPKGKDRPRIMRIWVKERDKRLQDIRVIIDGKLLKLRCLSINVALWSLVQDNNKKRDHNRTPYGFYGYMPTTS